MDISTFSTMSMYYVNYVHHENFDVHLYLHGKQSHQNYQALKKVTAYAFSKGKYQYHITILDNSTLSTKYILAYALMQGDIFLFLSHLDPAQFEYFMHFK